eukprot:6186716-Pleurochrysis_carterae.AAC.4
MKRGKPRLNREPCFVQARMPIVCCVGTRLRASGRLFAGVAVRNLFFSVGLPVSVHGTTAMLTSWFAGVYDGHSGDRAATLARDLLHLEVAGRLQQCEGLTAAQ